MTKVFALIVGVSHYPHLPNGGGAPAEKTFDLRQLTSPASSAFHVHTWLTSGGPAIADVDATLLVSPSPAELQANPKLAQFGPATRAGFFVAMKALRQKVKSTPDATAWIYFAGHGLQQTNRAGALLLSDFGAPDQPTFGNAVELGNLVDGMAPSSDFPDIARTQLWFVDACRVLPASLKGYVPGQASTVFDVALPDRVDDRNAPTFFATVPGDFAFGRPVGPSLFATALVRALEGKAADLADDAPPDVSPWEVSLSSLQRALASHFEALAQLPAGKPSPQAVTIDGFGKNVVLARVAPPDVEVEVTVDPAGAVALGQLDLLDENQAAVRTSGPPIAPHPFKTTVPAGFYKVRVTAQPPHVSRVGRLQLVRPPRAPLSGAAK